MAAILNFFNRGPPIAFCRPLPLPVIQILRSCGATKLMIFWKFGNFVQILQISVKFTKTVNLVITVVNEKPNF